MCEQLLAKPELAKLRINADLSHWCCVCEKVFDAADPRDDWWPPVLAMVAKHCHFIHCRVGHAEGPQVSSTFEDFVTLDGSFSAVWTATIASKDAFFSIF